MNHDACHCADYKQNKCPASCYRAKLTQELKERNDLYYLPIWWSNFKQTKECPIKNGGNND